MRAALDKRAWPRAPPSPNQYSRDLALFWFLLPWLWLHRGLDRDGGERHAPKVGTAHDVPFVLIGGSVRLQRLEGSSLS